MERGKINTVVNAGLLKPVLLSLTGFMASYADSMQLGYSLAHVRGYENIKAEMRFFGQQHRQWLCTNCKIESLKLQ